MKINITTDNTEGCLPSVFIVDVTYPSPLKSTSVLYLCKDIRFTFSNEVKELLERHFYMDNISETVAERLLHNFGMSAKELIEAIYEQSFVFKRTVTDNKPIAGKGHEELKRSTMFLSPFLDTSLLTLDKCSFPFEGWTQSAFELLLKRQNITIPEYLSFTDFFNHSRDFYIREKYNVNAINTIDFDNYGYENTLFVEPKRPFKY